MLTSILQDIRFGGRIVRREPGASLAAVLLITLAIGSATMIFSVAYGVLVRPLPWPEPDRVVRLEELRGDQPGRLPWTITNATYLQWRMNPTTVTGLATWGRDVETVTIGDSTERLPVASVTPSLLLTVIPVAPRLGRLLDDEDAAAFGHNNRVLVSYSFWQRRLDGRTDAIGRALDLNGTPSEIVGVLPETFAFPDRAVEIWTPQPLSPLITPDGVIHVQIMNALARLRPGATAAEASAEGTARARLAPDIGGAALALFGSRGTITVVAEPALDVAVRDVRPVLLIVLVAVGLLFATALASVVGVQAARAIRRRREVAVRTALGATRSRVLGQWLVEGSLIGGSGGLLGIGLTLTLHRLLPVLLPVDFPRLSDVTIDWRVLSFAVASSIAVTVISALGPSITPTRVVSYGALADDSATPAGSLAPTRSTRLRLAITAAQMAIACVLLVSSGLLVRSFSSLSHVNRGYDPDRLMTAGLTFPRQLPETRRIQIAERLEAGLDDLPGVTHAAFGIGFVFGRRIRDPRDPAARLDIQGYLHIVSANYLETIHPRLEAGRYLNKFDTGSTPPVVVVDRAFAAHYLGGAPLNSTLGLDIYDHPSWQVVGVIDDMQGGGVGVAADPYHETPIPRLYLSYQQIGDVGDLPGIDLAVRYERTGDAVAPMLRRLLHDQDPSLAFNSIGTMDDKIATSLDGPRAYTLLFGGFALFAICIASVGLSGVLSSMTAQRTREFGIRKALGATPADIVGLILRQAGTAAGGGLIVGLVAAYVGDGGLSKILYGIVPHDTVTFVAVPVALVLVACLACIVPARRAARLEPINALRAR